MSTGTGTGAQLMFAIEDTKNTRQVPTYSMPFLQEGASVSADRNLSQGLRAGREHAASSTPGNKSVDLSLSYDLYAESLIPLLELVRGGDPTTTGAGPFVHTFPQGALKTATFQLGKPPTTGAAAIPFDYIGAMCSSMSISGNAGENATAVMELMCRDEIFSETLGTYAEPSTLSELLANQATVTTPDGVQCFDSWTVQFQNDLESQYKACAADLDANGYGLATIRPNGWRSITGTLVGDFEDITSYARYLAGTQGTLSIELDGGTDAKFFVSMNIEYTGETPTVGGPGVVKQAIGYRQIGDTVTVTATNTVAGS